jgi:hypothetical protein
MKLFAIYIGGEHPKANIEVHDVRFAVAAAITDTYPKLKADWWGKPETLHVDCWAEIAEVQGYRVILRPAPSTASEKLFFVNLGGYDGEDFAEKHRNLFVVAASTADAKAKALGAIAGWTDAHKDDLYEAEHAFALETRIEGGLHIHLEPDEDAKAPPFTCRYTPLK